MFITSRIRFIAISLLVLSLSSIGFAQDRANPIPLSSTELKGALRPGTRVETYYSAEASGSLDFTVTVSSVAELALIEIEVLDTSYAPLFKLDVSSATPGGTERREAKCRIGDKQNVLLRINAPSANKSGSYNIKIKGNIAGASFKPAAIAAASNDTKDTKPVKENKVENWSELLKQSEPNRTAEPTANSTTITVTPRDADKSAAVASAVTNAAIKEIGADKRVALIIGNSSYDAQPLKNPVNDARAMAEALAECGFEVMMLENANKRRIEEAMRAFGAKLTPTSAGVFYFAGHGVQVGGVNYLIPLAAKIEKESDVEYEAVDAGRILNEFANAKAAMSIVILDACRDNPFSAATRSLTRGLAVVKMPHDARGTLIAYATSPGDVARDGSGKNGLYTEELLRHMRTPGLRLEDVFKLTRVNVKTRSNGQQVPWENSSIDGDFFFMRKKK
ncbi:MAG: CHAT domain-containing protein [Acidobacteria bacterium]|nr:CHAT domain-containing protein [Acidobacteriota bacterium]